MNQLLEDLIKVMTLERLEINLFRGQSRDIGSPQVFGGQVLGQALVAATATVENREVHSLHAYFLRRGDFNSPIVYEVDRARDGNHFSTRRVVAIQHGAQIFTFDYRRVRNYAFAALLGLIIVGFIGMFFHFVSPNVYSYLTLAIFSVLVVVDFKRVHNGGDGATAVELALSIYLDGLNIFLALTQLFSGSGRRR